MAKFSTIEEYVASLAEPLRTAAEQARLVIEAELPGAGAIWHGQPVWSLGPAPGKAPVCLLKGYPSYVTFGIWRGREVVDPSGRLATGGGMAHVKLSSTADVGQALFTGWLRQAAELERQALPQRG